MAGIGATCRYCGSTDVRPSRGVKSGSRYAVYRCNACRAYFKVARISYRDSLLMIGYVLFALLFVSIVASIYVITTQEEDLTRRDNAPGQAGEQTSTGELNSR